MYCQANANAVEDAESVLCFNVFLKLPPPCAIRIVKFSSAALELGEWRINRAVQRVRACIESKTWPTFVADDICDVDPWEGTDEEEIEIED